MTIVAFSFQKKSNEAVSGCMHASISRRTRSDTDSYCFFPVVHYAQNDFVANIFVSMGPCWCPSVRPWHLSGPFISTYSLLASWPSLPRRAALCDVARRKEKKNPSEKAKPSHTTASEAARAANLGQGSLGIPVQLPHLICEADLIPRTSMCERKEKCGWQ